MARLEFWHEYASTYSYLAAALIDVCARPSRTWKLSGALSCWGQSSLSSKG